MHSLGKCTDEQIAEFEKKHDIRLSDSMKVFLLKNNGMVWNAGISVPVTSIPETICVDALFGLDTTNKWLNMDFWLDQYGDELPSGTVILGSDVLEGFLLELNLPDASGIYYWDDKLNFNESSSDSNCYFVCESFDEFLKKYIKIN